MMMTLATTAIIFGALLGQRFKVFILVPAIVIASAAILAFGTAHTNDFWSILLVTALTITALQIGYLGGTIIRFISAGAHIGSDSPGTITVAQRSAR